MNVSLTVDYRVTWLPTLCSFVTETARALGADETEREKLHLAAEETAMHIMESIPHDDLEDSFEVICAPQVDGVEYIFKNLGPPVNVAALPAYDHQAPEESIEGLRLFLARKMVDRLEFINQGRDGWRTTVFKRLQAMKPLAATVTAPSGEPGPRPAPGSESVTTAIARPADAFEIVQMAYHNYRYSYAKESFYYAEKLQVELASKQTVSFIARIQSGPIVGHLALFTKEHSPTVREVGAVMVRPDYRRSRALLSLLKTVLRYVDENPERLDFYISNLVTAHTLSQKLAATMGMKPLALNVSTHPRARFMGLQSAQGRESNLYAVRVNREQAPTSIYLPPVHAAIAARLFGNLALNVTLLTDTAEPTEAQTTWTSSYDAKAGYATLTADRYCVDFPNSLRAAAYKLFLEKVETLALRLPAWQPLPPGLEEELQKQDFFFCGFVHHNEGRWHLAYSRLVQQHFSFDDAQVFDPVAEELKAYVAGRHQQLITTGILS
ncbi:MAG: putative anti-sigma regulatory factor, serine/threonine protein kinase [Rariglobus sp.]|nr:putative anti-sigma regulatory factor, serine/threonine protein kinase [Rariglobus sp.]